MTKPMYFYISSNLFTLSFIGGCVENSFVIIPCFFLNGVEIKRWAVALFALSTKGSGSLEIFFKALANPGGYLVNTAPLASAINSLFLLIANLIISPIIGLKIASIKPATINIIVMLLPLEFLLRLPPPHKKLLNKKSLNKVTIPIKTAVNIINLIS